MGPSPWRPLRLKCGTVLRNRFVLAPMTTDSSHPDGTVSADELRYAARRCANEFAACISSCAYVDDDGRTWQGIGAAGDAHLPSLRSVADTLRSGGGLAILQVYDGGRLADPARVGEHGLRAPSAIASSRPGARAPRAMATEEVERMVTAFADAARRGERAGFDGIELHGANHYLIHQFRSPRSNHRTDDWGGDRRRRMKFAVAAAASVCEAVGDSMVVGFRLSPLEQEAGGFSLDDSVELAHALVDHGVDYIHLSMDDFRRRAMMREDRDWTVANAVEPEESSPVTAIAEAVRGRCALVVSGGITTIEDAEDALGMGADVVAVGRAGLVDPEWLGKVKSGAHDAIRRRMPADAAAIESELTIPPAMARYLLSRPGWIPTESR